jgi:hypothetical protein
MPESEQKEFDPKAPPPQPEPLVGPEAFQDPHYDWVDNVVQNDWLPNAAIGKIVGSVLARVPSDSPVEHIVNVVRRAYFAHFNRPITPWMPYKEYRFGDRVEMDGKVYSAETTGVSGPKFMPDDLKLPFKLEDPQPEHIEEKPPEA